MHWVASSEKDRVAGTLEKRLWDAADQFRANSGLKSQEYSAPVLGLIFLRFAEVRFAAQRLRLEGTAARQPEREAAARSDGVFQPLLVHGVDVEWRISKDEIEAAIGVVRVIVVAIDVATVANFAFETVDREVQAAKASGFIGFLDAVDGEFRSGILFVLSHEARGLYEHATGTARWVEDAPVIRLDDFREEADIAARGVELAAFLTFGAGKFAQEVFINAPEGVVVHRCGNFDGAAARVGRNQTAFSFGDAEYSMVICGMDPDPANAELITKWTRDYWAAIKPYSLGGAYVNFLMEDEGAERVKATYRDNFERLVEIKTKYDPDNFFARNQNIQPRALGGKAG